jgi:hypothetical protein
VAKLPKALYSCYEYIFIIKHTEVNKMPGQDGTGPLGSGSLTGRGLGPCEGGMARGRGCGFGRGFRRFSAQRQIVGFTKEEEKKILEAELKEIDLEKQQIEKRLKEMQ